MMLTDAAGASRKGPRENNQDAFRPVAYDGVFAIADGMGGLAHGERMSAAAIERVEAQADRLALLAAEGDDDSKVDEARRQLIGALERFFHETATALYRMAEEEGRRMGTTLTAMVLVGDRVLIGHIGDTRVYRVRGSVAEVLTEDHSIAASRLRRGLLTYGEYLQSGQKGLLYQSLGPVPEVDPQVIEAEIAAGDVLVMCSDGVWGVLEPPEFARIVKGVTAEEAAEALVDAAVENGTDDNCTAVVVRVLDIGKVRDAPLPQELSRAALFAGFDEAELRHLVPYTSYRRLDEDQRVFEEGDFGEALYVVDQGAIEIQREGTPLAQLGPGDYFGDLSLAGETNHLASARAVVPSRLLVLDRRAMDDLSLRRPELAIKLLRRVMARLAERLAAYNQRVTLAERALWSGE
jgi:PPM family protein phosphatase